MSAAAVRARPVTTATSNPLVRWLFPAVPPERLAAVRILVLGYGTVYLAIRWINISATARLPERRFAPVGIWSWLDQPLSPQLVIWSVPLVVLVGVAATAGWRHRVTGPAFAAGLLALTTYEVSWGHISHTMHLVVLHTVLLSAAPAADAWSIDRRARRDEPQRDEPRRPLGHGWPLRLMAVALVASYVVAGIAKLRYGGSAWVTGDALQNQVAHDNLRKILLGDVHSPIGAALSGVGWLFPPMAAFTALIELGAPLALLGRRWARMWSAGAWAFHVGIVAVMAVFFPYPVTAIAFVCLHQPERWPDLVARRIGRPLRLGSK